MNAESLPTFEDLVDAFEWVSADPDGESTAYVSRKTGRVYWMSDAIESDEEIPEDIEDSAQYVAVPHKRDLDLGNKLALRFVAEHVPHRYEATVGFFHHSGAYRKFKEMLEREDRLEDWYKFEAAAVQHALREWATEHDLPIHSGPRAAEA